MSDMDEVVRSFSGDVEDIIRKAYEAGFAAGKQEASTAMLEHLGLQATAPDEPVAVRNSYQFQLDFNIDILDLSTRTYLTLGRAHIKTIRELIKQHQRYVMWSRYAGLRSVAGIGPKSIEEITEALAKQGIDINEPLEP